MESVNIEQRPRLSYTVAFRGIVVGGFNNFHPEKVDVSITRSIDYIEGEKPEDTRARVEAMSETEDVLTKHVDMEVGKKVKQIKDRAQSNIERLASQHGA